MSIIQAELITKMPRMYRGIVPLKIQDADRFFRMNPYHVTRSEVDFFLPAEGSTVGITWSLRAIPERDYGSGDLRAFVNFALLVRAKADIDVDIVYRLCIQSPTGTTLVRKDWNYNTGLKLKKERWVDPVGMENFEQLYLSDIDKQLHIFDGNLHVYADVFFEPTSGVPQQIDYPAPMVDMNRVVAAFHNSKFSDFVLIGSDGQQIKTHKVILASFSPVFEAMFDTDCQETRDGYCKIEDADAEGIRALLDCILGANVAAMDNSITAKVFQLADKYEMMPLKEKCEEQLAKKINLINVVDILLLADKHSAPVLKSVGLEFMEANIKRVIAQDIGLKLRRASTQLYKEWLAQLDPEIEEISPKRPMDETFSGSASKKSKLGD